MSEPTVAVIDIGSNSIKVLVATRDPAGGITVLKSRTIDARISAGISKSEPRLSEEGMARGLEAIAALLEDAREFAPARTVLVATSAVRDAHNGAEFRGHVLAATGLDIRILTGDEEANLIGRGLTCDPALAGLRDFYLFDLGGGSLECLAFRDRRVKQAVSLQLGCVRLTEKLVRDAALPLDTDTEKEIAAHVRATFASSGFAFALPPATPAVATGGTVATIRAILGARENKSFAQTDALLPLAQFRAMLASVGALPLDARKKIAGLPPPRADVFPTALATLIAVAEIGGLTAFRNSLYNLRFGLAADELAKLG